MTRKIILLAALGALACENSTPTNFAGTYSLQVVSGANNCNFNGWNAGSTTSNIAASFTQDGNDAQLDLQGLVGAYVQLIIGTSSFAGTVKDNEFTATYLGTTKATQGSCSYSVNVGVDATLDTNSVISGTLTYTPLTNNDPSCGTLNSCSNDQTVSGSRTGP